MKKTKIFLLLAIASVCFCFCACSIMNIAVNKTRFDIPPSKTYTYIDKSFVIYPMAEMDTSLLDSHIKEPAMKYLPVQFRSVQYATDSVTASAIPSDFYLELGVGLNPDQRGMDASLAWIYAKCFDSGWNEVLNMLEAGGGEIIPHYTYEERLEATYKGMDWFARKFTKKLSKTIGE